MASLSSKKRQAKRTHIIKTAAEVMSRKGYAGTVMADISTAADIGKGTLYEYFDSKEALFFEVFRWFSESTGAEAKISVSALGRSATDRLRLLNDTVMNTWTDLKYVYGLTMEFWSASASHQMRSRFKTVFRDSYREFREVVAALLRDGTERGEFNPNLKVEAIAAALVGTWDALLLQAWFDDEFDPVQSSRQFLDALFEGLLVEQKQL